MRIGYYPGCSLLGSSREFDESVRAVLGALGVDLVDVPDWSCCGASSAHLLDPVLALALPARVLALAEAAGLEEVLAPCAACSNRLLSTQKELAEHPGRRAEVESVLGRPLPAGVRVVNILQVLDRLRDRVQVVAPFARKVACYYGCLLVRPGSVVDFDRVEDPQSMDRLMVAVGATPLSWPHKTECCGAALSVSRTGLVAELSGRILSAAVRRGAEAIVVACPLCHANLDLRRPEIEAELGGPQPVPVLFATQAIGLAMGIDAERLGLHRHQVPVEFAPACTAV